MKTADSNPKKALISEILPFVVRIAAEHDMDRIAALRHATYGKHLPELAEKLRQPEASDYELGCAVIVAVSKMDGSLLGTLRTHANVFKPLPLQASLRLPEKFQDMRMVEATRLCVIGHSSSSMVRNALFKALFEYCTLQNVDWLMAAGRRPIDRIYDWLLFNDVADTGKFYPMAHANGLPHRVMSLSSIAEPIWSAAKHPLYRFVFETYHPDIDLSEVANLHFPWLCPETINDIGDTKNSLNNLEIPHQSGSFAHNVGGSWTYAN